jgi:rubredoxin
MFWAIDMILTNCWKIYESLYGPFLSPSGTRLRNTHREFLEALVELLFCCNSENYAEIVPGTTFKEYPKYSYTPHKAGRKPRYTEPVPPNLTDLSRETPFIFKGDPGRPRTSIPAKVTPISLYKHIKTTIRGYYFIYRNSTEVQRAQIAREKSIVYRTILKLSGETLEEVIPTSIEDIKGPKIVRGTKTLWKCSKCAVPICRPEEPCWDIAYKRLFSR